MHFHIQAGIGENHPFRSSGPIRERSILFQKKATTRNKNGSANGNGILWPSDFLPRSGVPLVQYRDEKISEGSAANTARLNLAIISHLFEIARKKWGMEGLANPVKSIRVPPPPKGRDRRLLPGEEELLMEACDSYKGDMPHIVRLAIETGMCRGEIAAMTGEMVDTKQRTITLLETMNGEKRIVPLSREAVRILSAFSRRIDRNIWGMTPDAITRAFLLILKRGREAYEKDCKEKRSKPDPKLFSDITLGKRSTLATSFLKVSESEGPSESYSFSTMSKSRINPPDKIFCCAEMSLSTR